MQAVFKYLPLIYVEKSTIQKIGRGLLSVKNVKIVLKY